MSEKVVRTAVAVAAAVVPVVKLSVDCSAALVVVWTSATAAFVVAAVVVFTLFS